MQTKNYLIIILSLLFLSCGDNDIQLSENILDEYLEIHADKTLDEVIACAGSTQENSSNVNVYYYPIIGSSDIRYFETESTDVDPNDFSNYTLKELPSTSILGGKLALFLRTETHESWGIVTYLSEGKIHKSNPIRFKQNTIPTEYSSAITIDETEPNTPKFSWLASTTNEDAIYFQALVENEGDFISGTYTTELCFKHNDNSNVILNINTKEPELLEVSKTYTMNIMGVSIDNWVNLHLIKSF